MDLQLDFLSVIDRLDFSKLRHNLFFYMYNFFLYGEKDQNENPEHYRVANITDKWLVSLNSKLGTEVGAFRRGVTSCFQEINEMLPVIFPSNEYCLGCVIDTIKNIIIFGKYYQRLGKDNTLTERMGVFRSRHLSETYFEDHMSNDLSAALDKIRKLLLKEQNVKNLALKIKLTDTMNSLTTLLEGKTVIRRNIRKLALAYNEDPTLFSCFLSMLQTAQLHAHDLELPTEARLKKFKLYESIDRQQGIPDIIWQAFACGQKVLNKFAKLDYNGEPVKLNELHEAPGYKHWTQLPVKGKYTMINVLVACNAFGWLDYTLAIVAEDYNDENEILQFETYINYSKHIKELEGGTVKPTSFMCSKNNIEKIYQQLHSYYTEDLTSGLAGGEEGPEGEAEPGAKKGSYVPTRRGSGIDAPPEKRWVPELNQRKGGLSTEVRIRADTSGARLEANIYGENGILPILVTAGVLVLILIGYS